MSSHPIQESSPISTSERLRHVAELLAEGVLRLRSRSALATVNEQAAAIEKPPKSEQTCLELPSESRLSGPHGLTARETQRPEES